MGSVPSSCYTRLEQNIRMTYRTIGAIGGSLLGHMGLALVAECVGSCVGEYFASEATPHMQDFSVSYPSVTRVLAGTTTMVVLNGLLEGKSYRIVGTGMQLNTSLAVALVGAVSFPSLYDACETQRLVTLLFINQLAGRIFGGYLALVLVGVVPELWNNDQWRSGYSVRMLRYEAIGLPLDAMFSAITPQGALPGLIICIPRIAFCSSLKGIAFQADRLVPFALKCARNMGLAKKQIVPLLIQVSLQKYIGEEKQSLIHSATRVFCKSLRKSVIALMPPLRHVMSVLKILPFSCAKPLEIAFKGGVKKHMNVAVHEGIEKLDANSANIISWILRSLLAFVKVIEEKDHVGIRLVHKNWQQAFLHNPGNDEVRGQKSLQRMLKRFLAKRYGARYPAEYKIVAELCKSQDFKKSMIEGLRQLPTLEKDLIGFSLTQAKHIAYWAEAFEIYLPHLLTVAIMHPQEVSRLMTGDEHHEVIEHIQKFVCDVYGDVVLPKKIAPWVRSALHKAIESVFTVQQLVAEFAGRSDENEPFLLIPTDDKIAATWEEVSKSAVLVFESTHLEGDKKSQDGYIDAPECESDEEDNVDESSYVMVPSDAGNESESQTWEKIENE